jgi:hypothetical protein
MIVRSRLENQARFNQTECWTGKKQRKNEQKLRLRKPCEYCCYNL